MDRNASMWDRWDEVDGIYDVGLAEDAARFHALIPDDSAQ